MNSEFKTVEFDCKFKMQVKIEEGMDDEQIEELIGETFDIVVEYGSRDLDEQDDYSAYMNFDNVRNIKIIDED